jgi:hypothetical protein
LTDEDPNWYGFVLSSSAYSKTITYTLNPPPAIGATDFNSTDASTPFIPQFCLGAPYEFMTNTGAQATPATMPDGSQGFIGLLPNCQSSSDAATTTAATTTASGPCVASRSTNQETGVITLVVDIPAGLPGDPWGRSA